jgi:hypothetical protein
MGCRIADVAAAMQPGAAGVPLDGIGTQRGEAATGGIGEDRGDGWSHNWGDGWGDGWGDNCSNFSPGLAILSSQHETQYSRLFRS